MKGRARILTAGLFTLAAIFAIAPKSSAIPFSQSKIIFEINSSAGDGGVQVFLDAVGWNELEIFSPTGEPIFQVEGSGSVGATGITELFFESAEPSFEDLPLDELLDRFQAGKYTFEGITVDGKHLSGQATLKHNIPDGPNVVSPPEDASLDPQSPIVIDWDPVTGPFPGTVLPVTITSYQVIVERVHPTPLLVFSVFLPASVTSVTVPAEFIEASANYNFEVLAIEASGNQTITEGSFETQNAVVRDPRMSLTDDPVGGSAAGVESHPRPSNLHQNQPNPFDSETSLEFVLPSGGATSLCVFDIHGRMVRTLVDRNLSVGQHRAIWDGLDEDGRPVAAGVYLVKLSGPNVMESKRMILTR